MSGGTGGAGGPGGRKGGTPRDVATDVATELRVVWEPMLYTDDASPLYDERLVDAIAEDMIDASSGRTIPEK